MGKRLAEKVYYPVYIPYTVDKIVYVEVPVETIVEKTVYTNEVNNFESREQLVNWLASIRQQKQLAAKPDWNCIDYAWWLMEQGRKDGWLIVFYPKYLDNDVAHRVCAVYIDGLTYLIEPWIFEVTP